MTIRHRVLGLPGRDNALYVEVDSGQSIARLQFDCGEACLRDLSIADIQSIDDLFFSHFHIDHVAGFDCFLRSNYDRPNQPVRVWGPVGAAEVIQHRLRGVTWNLTAHATGEFLVTEIEDNSTRTFRFRTCEGFATAHLVGQQPRKGPIAQRDDLRVDCQILDHGGIPSVAYCVRELVKSNIDTRVLAQLGLKPGPWLQRVKNNAADDEQVTIGTQVHRVGELRRQLLVNTPGESIAYLTDFCLDVASEARLVELIRGCTTVVCENNFCDADQQLAAKSFHMVSADVARLAAQAEIGKLVLFHLSDRYLPAAWFDQLAQVRAGFANTCFPESWSF